MLTRRLSFILLAVLLPVLVVLLMGTAVADESAADMLTLTVTPVPAGPVPAGEAAVFKVVLDNAGGQNQPDMYLEIKWDSSLVQRARVALVEEETTKIGTQGVRRAEGGVRWQGGILKDGRLTMLVTLLPAACYDDPFFFAVPAVAGKQAGGETLNAQASLEVNCPDNPFSADNISWEASIDKLSPLGVFAPAADILAGSAAHMRLQLTNESDEALNALVTGFLHPQAGQEEVCRVAAAELLVRTAGAPTQRFDRGYLPPGLNSEQMGDVPLVGFMLLELPPGETWTADLQLPLRGRVPGCEFSGLATVYPAPADPIPGSCDGGSPDCSYKGWTTQAADLRRLFTILEGYDSNAIIARLVAPDLGDAPASENNFEHKEMSAYSGVMADFPTVYNFNIGFPPAAVNPASAAADHREAPLHWYAQPLRLGNLSSIEREADINPGRNIIPLLDQANLDLRDDGWPVGELPGSCQPFTQKLLITTEEWAVDYLAEQGGKAYLNLFVDANGDGDWEDTTSCDGELAAEHLFINVPIDIAALGAGQHEISLPPNKGIMWETDGAWLRLTLSDKPAPLPLSSGDLLHGDGRGPAEGYMLGETEDYRLRVDDSRQSLTSFGADLGLRLETDLMFMANHTAGSLADDFKIQAADCLTCIEDCYGGGSIVNLINLGDLIAFNSKLTLLPDPAMAANDVQISVEGDLPWLDKIAADIACAAADPQCRIEIDLGDVPPQAQGSLVVYASASCRDGSQACKKTEYVVKAMVEAENDENSSNNQAQEITTLPVPPEWLEPPRIIYPIPGTAVGSELQVRGTGHAGRTVEIYANGVRVASGDVNNDGFFDIIVELALQEGRSRGFQLSAGYAGIPGGKRNPSPTVAVMLDNEAELFFEPMSLQFSFDDGDKALSFHPWDESGRVDPSGWQVPLLAGGKYGVSIETSWVGCLTCPLRLDNSGVIFEIGNQVVATLSDPDEDGVFEGSFTAAASMQDKPALLRLTAEGEEQIYQGRTVGQSALPKVVDGQTGQAVDGADFLVWQRMRVLGDQTIWIRPEAMNGQRMPGTTNKEGEIFLNVPPGVWQLGVILEEGANPLLTGPQRLFGTFPSGDVIINRPEFGGGLNNLAAGEKVVTIGREGFNPPVLAVSSGETVDFQNVSLKMRGVSSEEAGINSGLIAPGKSFMLSFDEPGRYALVDPQDPQNVLMVTVESDGGEQQVFLPVVLRRP